MSDINPAAHGYKILDDAVMAEIRHQTHARVDARVAEKHDTMRGLNSMQIAAVKRRHFYQVLFWVIAQKPNKGGTDGQKPEDA